MKTCVIGHDKDFKQRLRVYNTVGYNAVFSRVPWRQRYNGVTVYIKIISTDSIILYGHTLLEFSLKLNC